jgi:hypothetical protein
MMNESASPMEESRDVEVTLKREMFPEGAKFWDDDGTPKVTTPDGKVLVPGLLRIVPDADPRLPNPYAPFVREVTWEELAEVRDRYLRMAKATEMRDQKNKDQVARIREADPLMTTSDFAPGTRLFADEGEPVSISPDGVITNWFNGNLVVVPPSEFARTSPPSSLSFEDFSARVARYSETKEAMKKTTESPTTKPQPEPYPMKYQVICGDNFHYMDESENIPGNQYESAEAAIAAAKRIVEQSLWQHYEPGMTADDLYEYYTDFGDDPFIRTEDKSCVFSAWAYADARSKEICADDQ